MDCLSFVRVVTSSPVARRRPSRLLTTLRVGSAALAATLGCAPRAGVLAGVPTPRGLPTAELPRGHQRVTFRWEFSDGDAAVKGEGVARVAAPDSARLDFFVDNGLGGGYAVLIKDALTVPPGAEQVRRLLPPAPLLWAALGRLALPPAADTVARADGRVLRVDVGTNPRWRVTFDSIRLAEVTRINDGREVERVTRASDGRVEYRHLVAARRLSLTNATTVPAGEFDAAIWRP